VTRRFSGRLYEALNQCFSKMPVAALIGKKILCMHGGISPDLKSLDQIKELPRLEEIPDKGILRDILWSDPKKDIVGWSFDEKRKCSYYFGPDVIRKFLEDHDLNLICRGHEFVEGGYEFTANNGLVTIFSAPGYMGKYSNKGAIMLVDENLKCSFQIYDKV
jgi:serine/threonine-protein phosphatase PP1 catalytic subunit